MTDAHPLDWYPEPTDDQKGVPIAVLDRWVAETLAYEESRATPALIGAAPPVLTSAAASKRAREQWDQRVYFMRCLACGLVKIGFSKNVRARRAQLNRSGEHIVEVLGVHVGDRWTEAQVHGTFARDRVRGEWFRASDDLMDYIAKKTRPLEASR